MNEDIAKPQSWLSTNKNTIIKWSIIVIVVLGIIFGIYKIYQKFMTPDTINTKLEQQFITEKTKLWEMFEASKQRQADVLDSMHQVNQNEMKAMKKDAVGYYKKALSEKDQEIANLKQKHDEEIISVSDTPIDSTAIIWKRLHTK